MVWMRHLFFDIIRASSPWEKFRFSPMCDWHCGVRSMDSGYPPKLRTVAVS